MRGKVIEWYDDEATEFYCTAVSSDGNPLCGGVASKSSDLKRGIIYCGHDGGKYAPDYCSARCGFAVKVNRAEERQITLM